MRVVIPKEAFNPVYLPLLRESESRYLVLYGGAGSGKSLFTVQRLLVRLMEQPGRNLLVARAVAATHRDSTYALFKQVIGRWGLSGLFKCSNSELRITCINGSEVIFKGLDDPEKLKSVTFPSGELTDIWIEEASELSEGQFNQLDLRLRGQGPSKQITLTFNPISSVHWLKRRFFDSPDPRARVLKTTYKDNLFLDEDYRRTLEGYRESDPYYYQVYCLGEWGVLGRSVFHAAKAAKRLSEVPGPVERGAFVFGTGYDEQIGRVLILQETVSFVQNEGGCVSVYRPPEPGRSYVIGGDTAGDGSDYFTAQVVDLESGEQVCTLRGRMDEDVYAKQLYCLGRWYSWALTAVEANFSSYPMRELERQGYPNQYARERTDPVSFRSAPSYGFRTTSSTRPVIIAGLVEVVREHTDWINDPETLREMLSFVRNRSGRAEAQAGAHDDCVMALAIAYHVRRSWRKPLEEREWSFTVSRTKY